MQLYLKDIMGIFHTPLKAWSTDSWAHTELICILIDMKQWDTRYISIVGKKNIVSIILHVYHQWNKLYVHFIYLFYTLTFLDIILENAQLIGNTAQWHKKPSCCRSFKIFMIEYYYTSNDKVRKHYLLCMESQQNCPIKTSDVPTSHVTTASHNCRNFTIILWVELIFWT